MIPPLTADLLKDEVTVLLRTEGGKWVSYIRTYWGM
jgi:hypothetical protein